MSIFLVALGMGFTAAIAINVFMFIAKKISATAK